MSDLRTEDMAAIAERLPAGGYLVRNEVGNLAILDADRAYIGYVDFGLGLEPGERVVILDAP